MKKVLWYFILPVFRNFALTGLKITAQMFHAEYGDEFLTHHQKNVV